MTREWKFGENDFARMNVNGSGISLGHPVGATGVRILATLLNEMQRREARYGLETLCIGGGQGIAAIFERHCLDWPLAALRCRQPEAELSLLGVSSRRSASNNSVAQRRPRPSHPAVPMLGDQAGGRAWPI